MHTSWRFRTSSSKYKWLNYTVGFADTEFFYPPSPYQLKLLFIESLNEYRIGLNEKCTFNTCC